MTPSQELTLPLPFQTKTKNKTPCLLFGILDGFKMLGGVRQHREARENDKLEQALPSGEQN